MYLPPVLGRVLLRRALVFFSFNISCLYLVGCASVTPLSESDTRALRYQSVVVSQLPTPSLKIISPGSSVTSGISDIVGGGEAVNPISKSILAVHPVVDPAVVIQQQLIRHLENLHSIRVVDPSDHQDARYRLVVGTQKWGLEYQGLQFDRYQLTLRSHVQIFETQTNFLLAQATCEFKPDDKQNTPMLADYLDDNLSTFALEVERATHFCTNLFISGLFPANGLHSPSGLLPTRQQFLAKGPAIFQLPDNQSSISPVKIHWQNAQAYLQKEQQRQAAREEEKQRHLISVRQTRKAKGDEARLVQRDSQTKKSSSSGSLRNMTACQTNPGLFAFCNY